MSGTAFLVSPHIPAQAPEIATIEAQSSAVRRSTVLQPSHCAVSCGDHAKQNLGVREEGTGLSGCFVKVLGG